MVKQRVAERQALSDWHHRYARDTAAIVDRVAGRGKRADWYRTIEHNRKDERKQRKRQREEASSSESAETARPSKRPRT
jgi:hypothetical protein